MFKAVKLLNIGRKYDAIKVEDESGKTVAHPNKKLNIVTNFLESKFQNSNKPFNEAFFGEPRKLKKPITKEVRKSINKLNNNRAPRKDGSQEELLKYGPETIDSYIANIINESFEKHEILDINAGEIIPLPKPGKPKGPPKNLRPITLLNTIQKTFSTIVLERIIPQVEKYISHSQSGFRPNRSTADVAWTHKWLATKTLQEKINITITGIDIFSSLRHNRQSNSP
ncbi:retrovirus-related Pol polyprotein LINE-1 [Elysia marginata]|uniref:Retrovirus-related Pol polyprotein LINE-1 n=1 Tax=Elysia marginata TaxID=1093978 RepID=A0AAV4JD33_9GAST|nr:retrovirus-related Pol polyprotein LINE-1 [Elysia marginata]